jgi:hypothetical protein
MTYLGWNLCRHDLAAYDNGRIRQNDGMMHTGGRKVDGIPGPPTAPPVTLLMMRPQRSVLWSLLHTIVVSWCCEPATLPTTLAAADAVCASCRAVSVGFFSWPCEPSVDAVVWIRRGL